MKAYLAGPEVFLPDSIGIGARKKTICRRYGIVGLYPLDQEIGALEGADAARSIFAGNVAMIRKADVVIANLTPFRSISADPGTAFEVGMAFAHGRPVHGYSNHPASLFERTAAGAPRGSLPAAPDGRLLHVDGMAIEDFDLADNLMLIEAIRTSGGRFHAPAGGEAFPLDDLSLFEACVAAAAPRACAAASGAATASG